MAPECLRWQPYLFDFFLFSFSSLVCTYEPPITENLVFWVIGIAIFSAIVPIEWVTFRKHNHDLKIRWRKPKIGILNYVTWDTKNKEMLTYTDISPDDWKIAFKTAGLSAELIDIKYNLAHYVAVLNPYGGVYPETNLRELSVLNKLIDFTCEGGVFVNIADIPTYWAYNVNLKRRVDTTEPIFTYSNNILVASRPFQLTPLMKDLGLSVLNVRLKQDFKNFSSYNANIFSERVAIMESNMENLIPVNILVMRGNATDSECPISYLCTSAFFRAKYGEGDFIFSLIFLHDGNHTQQEKDIIKQAIVQSTVKQIKEKIQLIVKK